jgi:hypothetical protein
VFHDVYNPKSVAQKFFFFKWGKLPGCKTGVVERRPKAVSRPGEMMPDGCCVQTGVYSAKKHLQPGCDNVGD